jgi:hypothetical protein
MSLPEGFQFSQGNLQDFIECRRRFHLRYLLNLAWPAVQTEPILEQERFMQQGARFHRLVQQHQLGLPAERLAALIHDEKLMRWWESYLSAVPQLVEGNARYPELNLSAPVIPTGSQI